MQTAITDARWFTTLVSECKQIIEEAKVTAGMVLIEAKYDLGNRILPDYEKFGSYDGGKTQQDLADELGFSKSTISDCIRFAERLNEEYGGSFERFSNTVGKLSWRKIALEWLPRKRHSKTLVSEITDIEEPRFRVLLGDFRERGVEIPDESIHLILTDPPYGEAYLDRWGSLSELAERVLIPGGFLVTYSGQFYLPEVLASLKSKLQYFWTFSLKMHNRNLINPRNIYNLWKPILVFYKEPLHLSTSYLVDHITGSGREKELHDWQQSEREIDVFIENLSPRGGLVLDPMAGSGTTLASALRLGRKAIGIDLDPKNIEEMKRRLG